MEQYYLRKGSKTIGPFEIKDLKERKISKQTAVWTDEMDDWTTAEKVEELKSIIKTPPIFFEKLKWSRNNGFFKLFLITISLFALAILGFYLLQ